VPGTAAAVPGERELRTPGRGLGVVRVICVVECTSRRDITTDRTVTSVSHRVATAGCPTRSPRPAPLAGRGCLTARSTDQGQCDQTHTPVASDDASATPLSRIRETRWRGGAGHASSHKLLRMRRCWETRGAPASSATRSLPHEACSSPACVYPLPGTLRRGTPQAGNDGRMRCIHARATARTPP